MRIQQKPALLVALLIVLAGLGLWYASQPAKTRLAAPTAIPVRVVSVIQKDVPRYVTGIGSVLSLHSVVVRPQIDGISTKLLVKEGQLVNKGRPAGHHRRPLDPRQPRSGQGATG